MPLYTLKIRKSWEGRNSKNSWVNNYDLVSSVPLDDPQWVTIVEAFAQMERSFHLSQVHFLSAVVSTWNQEPVYEWENLRTFSLQNIGAVVEAAYRQDLPESYQSIAADLNFALQVNKVVTLGRAGKMFYRGALLWPDIVVDGNGKPTLTQEALARYGTGNADNAYSRVADVAPLAQWVMGPNKPSLDPNAPDVDPTEPGDQQTTSVRHVLGIQTQGVIMLKRDHRWFDKKPRGTGGAQDNGVPSG